MSREKVWLVTGASRGFGRTWTEAALAKGDRVVAAVRDVASVSALSDRYGGNILPVQLDVAERSQVFTAARCAIEHFGRIDVLINNAGYCLAGAVEEVAEADARALFDTNVFGALWVTQAVLPIMRAQASGHIIAVSSVSGLVGQPTIGMYNASKWALEGMMESLSEEISDLGIKVSILEPAIYATEFTSPTSMRFSQMHSAYDGARSRLYASLGNELANDPLSSVAQLMALVDSDDPPLRLLLGGSALGWAVRSYSNRLASWVR